MKLYLISRELPKGWDIYDSAVVVAASEEDARNIHPSEYVTHVKEGKWMGVRETEKGEEYEFGSDCWVKPANIDQVKVEYLGETKRERGVVLSSQGDSY